MTRDLRDSPMSKPLSDQELPAHLGLGTLDPASVSTQAGKTKATYRLDGDLIYQVTLGKGQCVIRVSQRE